MTKSIPLTQGQFALVDDADYEWLMQWKWRYCKSVANRYGYAFRSFGKYTDRHTTSMHREIMKANRGQPVDHIDHDGLNNQRHNLRLCTTSQNGCNARVFRKKYSQLRGVSFHKKDKRWQSQIVHLGKCIYLGRFGSPEEAARAYDAAATRLHGQFATLNFP